MTSLKDIAHSMRKQVWSYVPLVLPLWLVTIGIHLLEAVARIIKVKPFASSVQIAFSHQGVEAGPWQGDQGVGLEAAAIGGGHQSVPGGEGDL